MTLGGPWWRSVISTCEAPGYNIFIVNGDLVRTPWEDILEGITCETVIQMSRDLGCEVQETTIELYDVHTADEVFFCSTAGGLLPVVEVDGRQIGNGNPGNLFTKLRQGYQDILASGVDGTAIYSDAAAAQ